VATDAADGRVPGDVLGAILADVAPDAPLAADARPIRDRVAARLADFPRPMLQDEGWRPFLERNEMKVLRDDGITRSWLLRLAPGGELP